MIEMSRKAWRIQGPYLEHWPEHAARPERWDLDFIARSTGRDAFVKRHPDAEDALFPERRQRKEQAAQEMLQQKVQQVQPRVIQTPTRPQLILPNNYTSSSLPDDVLVDLYERSRAQAGGDRTFHHAGEDQLDANMLTRFFTSNLAAELVAKQMRNVFPEAMAEVRARPIRALNRGTDGGSDIAGLPAGRDIDIKYVGGQKPSNVTSRVGNQLEQALARGEDSMLSFYQQRGGYISNDDLTTVDTLLNRMHDNPQRFSLRGHVLASDFIPNSSRRRLGALREPQYVLPDNYNHGNNKMLIDFLMSRG